MLFSIAEPIRHWLHRFEKDRVNYYEGKCIGIEPEKQIVHWQADDGRKFTMNYDKLVIAVGGEVNTYGVKGVSQYCKFLKDLDGKISENIIQLISQTQERFEIVSCKISK